MNLKYKLLHCWYVFGKILSFIVFGEGSFFLATVLFPLLYCLSGFSKNRYGKWARFVVCKSLKLFVLEMRVFGFLDFKVHHLERLKNVKSKIIVANHPSLLDVVMLFSLIPNADCLVKGSLSKNKFMSGIINSIYILNTEKYELQVESVKKSMLQGNCLIIFPEGTRSTPGQPWVFKKGAARFAIESKCDIIPIYFGGTELVGIRKHDKIFDFRRRGKYLFHLDVLDLISVEPYLDIPLPQASSLLTKKVLEQLEKRRLNDMEYAQDDER